MFWKPVVLKQLLQVLDAAPAPRVMLFAPLVETRSALNVVAAKVAGDDCPEKSHAAITESTNIGCVAGANKSAVLLTSRRRVGAVVRVGVVTDAMPKNCWTDSINANRVWVAVAVMAVRAIRMAEITIKRVSLRFWNIMIVVRQILRSERLKHKISVP